MALTLVRHTRPNIEEGICYGKLDLALANTFEAEAESVLAQLQPAEILVSSPLQRCKRLAEKISTKFNQAVIIDERLREMDFGAWEGLAWDTISHLELDNWGDNFYHARPHGGESVEMFTNRVKPAITEYLATGKSHIVVCHAGVIKVATSRGKTANDYATTVPFGGLLEIDGVE